MQAAKPDKAFLSVAWALVTKKAADHDTFFARSVHVPIERQIAAEEKEENDDESQNKRKGRCRESQRGAGAR
jgi:hypothetical protein